MKIILKRPIITEKSNKASKDGVFTFLVGKLARKDEIKKAVEEKFDVKVVSVKTANFVAQTKSQRSRKGYFTVSGFKKAMVQLKKGQTIGLFAQESAEVEVKTADSVKEKKSLLKGTKVKIEKQSSAISSQSSDKKNKQETDKKKGSK